MLDDGKIKSDKWQDLNLLKILGWLSSITRLDGVHQLSTLQASAALHTMQIYSV